MDGLDLPNARIRLRRESTAPGAPDRSSELTLWLDGPRFRLRDHAGRPLPDVLADVTAPRGFGRTARSMEDFATAWTPAEHPRRPTEIFVDGAAGQAVVVEGVDDPWRLDATDPLRLLDLVLARGREQELSADGEETVLDRVCRRYRFELRGEEQGTGYRTEVQWWIFEPYLLRRELRDLPHGRLSMITEVVQLDEGVVTSADVGFADPTTP